MCDAGEMHPPLSFPHFSRTTYFYYYGTIDMAFAMSRISNITLPYRSLQKYSLIILKGSAITSTHGISFLLIISNIILKSEGTKQKGIFGIPNIFTIWNTIQFCFIRMNNPDSLHTEIPLIIQIHQNNHQENQDTFSMTTLQVKRKRFR